MDNQTANHADWHGGNSITRQFPTATWTCRSIQRNSNSSKNKDCNPRQLSRHRLSGAPVSNPTASNRPPRRFDSYRQNSNAKHNKREISAPELRRSTNHDNHSSEQESYPPDVRH